MNHQQFKTQCSYCQAGIDCYLRVGKLLNFSSNYTVECSVCGANHVFKLPYGTSGFFSSDLAKGNPMLEEL